MLSAKYCSTNIIIIIGITSHQLQAQSDTMRIAEYQDTKNVYLFKSDISFYFELLGKGFYSVNADYRKNMSTAISVGFQFVEDAFIPSFMFYHLSGESFRSEYGGGVSGIVTSKDGFVGIMIHGNIGYRYQKKDNLLFRITFAPFMGIPLTTTGKFVVLPWVGASIGYTL